MSPKTGNEKPRQPRGDHLQTKTNAARQYKKTVPNFPPPENPKSHDNPEESFRKEELENAKVKRKFSEKSEKVCENREK